MKRQIFIFPILLLSVFLFSCEEKEPAPTPVLALSPATIPFETVEVGDTLRKDLTIENTGNVDLFVTKIIVPDGYSVKPEALGIAAGSSGKVTVSFMPTGAGAANGDLTVVSNKTSGENTVALTGTGQAPVIAFTSDTLHFGTVNVGESLAKDVTIKNTGNEPLDVTSITVPSGYSVSPTSLMVATGDSLKVTVTFTPPSGGDFDSLLTFVNNKISEGNTVVLTGKAPTLLSIDFETNPMNSIETWGGNMYGHVDNPSKTGINTSNKVGKSLHGNVDYSGLGFTLPDTITYLAGTTFRMKVRADVIGPILFKLENSDNSEEVRASYTEKGKWQELSFDFQAMPITTFTRISLFFNYPETGDSAPQGEIFYFDDIVIE